MATALNKPLDREVNIEGQLLILTLTPTEIVLRIKGRQRRVFIPLQKLLDPAVATLVDGPSAMQVHPLAWLRGAKGTLDDDKH